MFTKAVATQANTADSNLPSQSFETSPIDALRPSTFEPTSSNLSLDGVLVEIQNYLDDFLYQPQQFSQVTRSQIPNRVLGRDEISAVDSLSRLRRKAWDVRQHPDSDQQLDLALALSIAMHVYQSERGMMPNALSAEAIKFNEQLQYIVNMALPHVSPEKKADVFDRLIEFGEDQMHEVSQKNLAYTEKRARYSPASAHDPNSPFPALLDDWGEFLEVAHAFKNSADLSLHNAMLAKLVSNLGKQGAALRYADRLEPGWTLSLANHGRQIVRDGPAWMVLGIADGVTAPLTWVGIDAPNQATGEMQKFVKEGLPYDPEFDGRLSMQAVGWASALFTMWLTGKIAIAAVGEAASAGILPTGVSALRTTQAATGATLGLAGAGQLHRFAKEQYAADDAHAAAAFALGLALGGAAKLLPAERLIEPLRRLAPQELALWVKLVETGSLNSVRLAVTVFAGSAVGRTVIQEVLDTNADVFSKESVTKILGSSWENSKGAFAGSMVLHTVVALLFASRQAGRQFAMKTAATTPRQTSNAAPGIPKLSLVPRAKSTVPRGDPGFGIVFAADSPRIVLRPPTLPQVSAAPVRAKVAVGADYSPVFAVTRSGAGSPDTWPTDRENSLASTIHPIASFFDGQGPSASGGDRGKDRTAVGSGDSKVRPIGSAGRAGDKGDVDPARATATGQPSAPNAITLASRFARPLSAHVSPFPLGLNPTLLLTDPVLLFWQFLYRAKGVVWSELDPGRGAVREVIRMALGFADVEYEGLPNLPEGTRWIGASGPHASIWEGGELCGNLPVYSRPSVAAKNWDSPDLPEWLRPYAAAFLDYVWAIKTFQNKKGKFEAPNDKFADDVRMTLDGDPENGIPPLPFFGFPEAERFEVPGGGGRSIGENLGPVKLGLFRAAIANNVPMAVIYTPYPEVSNVADHNYRALKDLWKIVTFQRFRLPAPGPKTKIYILPSIYPPPANPEGPLPNVNPRKPDGSMRTSQEILDEQRAQIMADQWSAAIEKAKAEHRGTAAQATP